MAEATTTTTMAISFLLGVLLHHALFKHARGEWHRHSWFIALAYSLPSLLTLALNILNIPFYFNLTWISLTDILTLTITNLAGLFTSITLHRALFHPLRRFPGPFPARLSAFYKIALSPKMQVFKEVHRLHSQYGDFVRIGPSELSLAHPEAIKAIHWPRAIPTKAPFYDTFYPKISVESTRDHAEHARLRKIWDRAFNAKALRQYSPRVKQHAAKLRTAFDESGVLEKGNRTDKGNDQGGPGGRSLNLNLTKWMTYFAFDVMGDLAFGKSFNMLDDDDNSDHYILSVLHSNMLGQVIMGAVPWLAPLIVKTPLVNGELVRFFSWLRTQVKGRRENPPSSPDVFHWLLQGYGEEFNLDTPRGVAMLESEAQLVVIAGSDTTSVTLTNAIFEVLNHPQHIQILRIELEALLASKSSNDKGKPQLLNLDDIDPDDNDLAKLPHLNAIINETLRLHPVVPSGLPRITPPEGMKIGDVYIPGDTVVSIPMHTLFRDQRLFHSPESFIPERWTTKPELVNDSSVFVPFSFERSNVKEGAYSCVGKQLALMEMRWVLALIVWEYDISFAPGYDAQSFERGAVDAFILACAPLEVAFRRREM